MQEKRKDIFAEETRTAGQSRKWRILLGHGWTRIHTDHSWRKKQKRKDSPI